MRDINTTAYDATGRTGSSHPTSFFRVGGAAVFIADDGVSGRELWRTDGTAAGTYRLVESRLGYDGIDAGAPLAHAPFKSGAIVFTSPDMIYTDGTRRRHAAARRRTRDQVFQAGGRLYWLDATRRSVLAFDGTTLGTAFALTGGGVGGQALSIDAQGRLVFSWQAQFGSERRHVRAGDRDWRRSVLPRQSVPHPHVDAAPSIASQPRHVRRARVLLGPRTRHLRDRRHARRAAQDPRRSGRRSARSSLPASARVLRARDRRRPSPRAVEHRRHAEGTRRVAQVDEQDRTAAGESPLVALREQGRVRRPRERPLGGARVRRDSRRQQQLLAVVRDATTST